MYFASARISDFYAFITGYLAANVDFEVDFAEQEVPPFDYFSDWTARHYKWSESTAGWKNIILEEVGDEVQALETFFDILDEYRHHQPTKVAEARINPTFQSSLQLRRNNVLLPPDPMPLAVELFRLAKGFFYLTLRHEGEPSSYSPSAFTSRSAAKAHAKYCYGVAQQDWNRT